MRPHRFVCSVVVSFVLTFGATAFANATHHHHSGGGGDGEGPCIRWEKLGTDAGGDADDGGRVVAAPSLDASDGAADPDADAGAADAANDASAEPIDTSGLHVGERCVEHAGACSVRRPGAVAPTSFEWSLAALAAAAFLWRLRRSRNAR